MTDEQIIFLISQPRSGSTLLQAILGSHPEIFTCTEPWIALPFIYALKKEGSEFEFNGRDARHALKGFLNENGINEIFYQAALNSFLKSLYSKAMADTGKRIFLDKTPRYYEVAIDLIKIFPNAKFIILFRHPLAVLNSILNTWVNEKIDMLYYHSRDLLVAPTKLINFISKYKENLYVVKYENLVSSPQTEIAKICAYLGINYFDEMINYKSDMEWTSGDKKFKEKKVPDSKSVEAWRNQLENKRYTNFCFYYLRELGEELVGSLGYDFFGAMEQIKKHNPDDDDFKTWKIVLHGKYISSIEEQRLQVREEIQSNFIKKLYKKITS